MANDEDIVTGVLYETDADVNTLQIKKDVIDKKYSNEHEQKLIFIRVAFLFALHVTSLYGLYLAFTAAQWKTNVFATILYITNCYGITAGAHRLWSHRAYKATWQLRLLLVIFNTMAFHITILQWVWDHRLHHKYVETNADPYNAKRGFFYAHIGWYLVELHPDVKEKGKGIDLSDLYADPMVMFQHRHYFKLVPIFCYIIPTVIPMYFWNETLSNSFFVACVLRQCACINAISCINSVAHLYGSKPYDKSIYPVENLFVSTVNLGEGYHNYHHVFPWDYRASELGSIFNSAASFIDFFAKIGWAYELKSVSAGMIQKRAERTGDGSHSVWGEKPV